MTKLSIRDTPSRPLLLISYLYLRPYGLKRVTREKQGAEHNK